MEIRPIFVHLKHYLYGVSPLLTALVVLGTAVIVFFRIDSDCNSIINTVLLPENPFLSAKYLASTITWSTSLFVFYVGTLTVVGTSIAIIWQSFDAFSRSFRIVVISGVGIAALLVSIAFNLRLCTPQLVLGLYSEVLKGLSSRIPLALRVGAIAIAYVIAASCAILLAPRQHDENKVRHLSQQNKELRILLYISSLFLMAGIFEIKSLFTAVLNHILPLNDYDKLSAVLAGLQKSVFAKQQSAFMIVKEVLDSVLFAVGAVCTGLLAAVYLPAAFILEARIRVAKAANVEEELGRHGDSTHPEQYSVFVQAANLFAALAPFVLGGSMDFLGKLANI